MPIPANHPFAWHLRYVAGLEAARAHEAWTPGSGPMPVLYLAHGNPLLFEDPTWMAELHRMARAVPRPRAILVVSAHWESAAPAVSGGDPGTGLVYDFEGFAPMYHDARYATPDASGLAREVRAILPGGVHEHTTRGLDHGAWIPLKAMYPGADIPVSQLSLPTGDPHALLALGDRLRPLREQGVLIIGSGHLTHGLPYLTPEMVAGSVPGWSADFDAWAAQALDRGDVEELAAFRDRAPGMPYAHPTVEHFTPLFVALGAAGDPTAAPATLIDGFKFGLSKRSVVMA